NDYEESRHRGADQSCRRVGGCGTGCRTRSPPSWWSRGNAICDVWVRGGIAIRVSDVRVSVSRSVLVPICIATELLRAVCLRATVVLPEPRRVHVSLSRLAAGSVARSTERESRPGSIRPGLGACT